MFGTTDCDWFEDSAVVKLVNEGTVGGEVNNGRWEIEPVLIMDDTCGIPDEVPVA